MIIDVSVHNGTLNWEQLKGQIEAAIIRCGYGQNLQKQDDKQFLRNVTECERLGIPYGLYLYSYAGTEAEARGEAQHVKRLLNGRRLTLPVFYDLEEKGKGYMARKNFYAFEEEMGSAARVGLYTGEYYYNTYMHGVNAEIRWIAKYGTNNGRPQKPPVLSDGRAVDLWQYTSEAMGGHMDASQIMNRERLFREATPAKSVDELAQEVIAGKYGIGDARKAALGSQYEAVQKRVNEILSPEAPAVSYTIGKTYKLAVPLRVRTGPGTNYKAKKHSQLSADGQRHDRNGDGCLDEGTVVTCLEQKAVGSDVWIRTPSGWIAGYYHGQKYIE